MVTEWAICSGAEAAARSGAKDRNATANGACRRMSWECSRSRARTNRSRARTNRMLRAEKWGWQYCTPDLKDVAEKSMLWKSDMLDAHTGQTFSRDVAAGET